ncbi:MAG: hypothetical protein WCA92_02975, partial [Terriglobales bacterium]
MRLISLEFESRLRESGLWPESRLAWATLYVLALDLFVFAVQLVANRVRPALAASLTAWVIFLSLLAVVLLTAGAYRWLRSKLLWRLRNRLIVTYVFIGVIPVFLLVVISLGSLYLLARQFAGFVVTTDIATHLRSMEASNRAIARALTNQLERGGKPGAGFVEPVRPRRPEWARRQVCAWYGEQPLPNCAGPDGAPAFSFPEFVTEDFADVVRDKGTLYLRAATVVNGERDLLRVVTSERLDKNLMEQIAKDLGKITFSPNAQDQSLSQPDRSGNSPNVRNGELEAPFSAGAVPPAANTFDFQIPLPVPVEVVD